MTLTELKSRMAASSDIRTAIYLCGQGPYREPYPIEVQHLRIIRYLPFLEKALDRIIEVVQVETDLNWPRNNGYMVSCDEYMPSGLRRLAEQIRAGAINMVLMNYWSDSWGPSLEGHEGVLRRAGATIINVAHDPFNLCRQAVKARYGDSADIHYDHHTDFITFFPTLAASIAEWSLTGTECQTGEGYHPQKVERRLSTLREQRPYPGGEQNFYPFWMEAAVIKEQQAIRHAILVERRNTELLYRIGPTDDMLYDEYLKDSNTQPRTQEEWIFAEARLHALQFQKTMEDRHVSYTRQIGPWIVYADPRGAQAITFRAYPHPTQSASDAITPGTQPGSPRNPTWKLRDRQVLPDLESRFCVVFG